MFSLSGVVGATLDFQKGTPLKKSYLIAASYRSGSTYFSRSLWKTGLLGAPSEYFNYEADTRLMYARLGASSPQDYVDKLLAVRTSPNGVFGVKVHYHHLMAVLRQCPDLLSRLSPHEPLRFIYISRGDKVAQAVSLAKAFQTGAWNSISQRRAPLFYSKEFIDACLVEIEAQVNGWERWFGENRVTPLVVGYESILKDSPGVVEEVKKFVGVTFDKVTATRLPEAIRQSDSTNAEWIERYCSESRSSLIA